MKKTAASTTARRQTGVQTQTSQWWHSVPLRGRYALIALLVALAGFGSYVFAQIYGLPHNKFDLHLYYDAVNWWKGGNDLYAYAQWDKVNISLGYTYPPIAAVLMSPMGVLPWKAVSAISVAAIVLAGAACLFLVLRERIRLPRELMFGLVGVATAVAFMTEPFRQTLAFGQINLYLAFLVLLDLLVLGRRGSKWTGVGIGLATAIKLTPGIFIIYLLVTRRWRPAVTAILAFVGAGVLAALVAPSASWHYFTSLMWQTSRVGFLDTTLNQSVNGLLARISAPDQPNTTLWLLLAAALAAFGLRRAARAWSAGDTLCGLTLAGLVGALVSPVTWVHHIFWIAPALVLLTTRVITAGAAQLRARRAGDRGLPLGGLVGWTILLITALPVWFIPTARLMHIEDTDYATSGLLTALAGSVQLLWIIAAVFLLPIVGRDRAVQDEYALAAGVQGRAGR